MRLQPGIFCFVTVAILGAPVMSHALKMGKLKVKGVVVTSKVHDSLIQCNLSGRPVTVHFYGPSRVLSHPGPSLRRPAEVRIGPRVWELYKTELTRKLSPDQVRSLANAFAKQARKGDMLWQITDDIRRLLLPMKKP
jgi:hypothetical protein